MKVDQTPSYNLASGICVEVGTWQGGFTESLLSKTEVTKVFCVDPYKHFTNNEYPDGMNNLTQKDFDNLFSNVSSNLKSRFNDKVEFIIYERKHPLEYICPIIKFNHTPI